MHYLCVDACTVCILPRSPDLSGVLCFRNRKDLPLGTTAEKHSTETNVDPRAFLGIPEANLAMGAVPTPNCYRVSSPIYTYKSAVNVGTVP